MFNRFLAGFISVFPFMYMNIKGLPFNKVGLLGGWCNVGDYIRKSLENNTNRRKANK